MEDPRIRKFAQFLIRSAVGLEKGEKILIELHGSETGLMKALVQEAYAVGGKPFVHIFDYAVEGALVQGADAEHMEEIASYELERMRDMDAYIDIRATTNISMCTTSATRPRKRYRPVLLGPHPSGGAVQPYQVVRAPVPQRCHGPAGGRFHGRV